MADYMVFASKAGAAEEIRKSVRGWRARPVQLYMGENFPGADKHGNVWVIECKPLGKGKADPMYLRENGFVR